MLQVTKKSTFKASVLAVLMLLLSSNSQAQSVYKEDFGSSSSVALPYAFGTNATGSASKNSNFSTPSWTQTLSSASFAGSSGGCMSGTGATNTMTCTFTVASGFRLTPASIAYNYRISGTGPTTLNIAISGTGGSTSIAQVTTSRSGSFVGVATTSFASTTQNLTGNITLTFTFSGGAGTGTMRLDDVQLNGTVVASTPTITGAATTAAFTSTYGTASAAQSFSVSGVALTANLVATAPTGFQVSSDGTNYGTTATFTQSGGSASGTLRIRLAANAAVGAYNSKIIALSSTGATTVNITTPSSGNAKSAKALTITGLSGVSREYNGTTTASLNGTPAYSGLVNSESFSVTGTPSANFANKNVANGKAITVTGFTAPSSNYTVSQPTGLSANVTPKDLTVTDVTANDKTYDGTVNATLSGTLNGVVSPDNVQLVATGEFENSFQTIFFGTPANIVNLSFALSGSDVNNYNLIQPVINGLTADIFPKELTVSNPIASDKVYDGNTDAVVSGTLDGVISGDVVTLISSGTFASADIGTNIAVTPTWSIDGDTFNYTLTEPTVSLTANITSPGAPIVTSATSASATYGDLATSYTITTNVAVDSYDATGLPTGLSINTATGEITGTPTAAGIFNVTLSATNNGGTGFASLTYTINTINLTIVGASANNKQYDGNTDATITGTLTGGISGDDVSFDGAGTFNTALVGTNIFVTSNIVLTGTKATNYTLTQPSGLSADITAKSLTVIATVNDREYAGSTNTVATVNVDTVNGVVGSEVVTVNASGAFDTGFAGNGKDVTVNYTLSGADASNYSIASPVTLTANITKKPLTYTATADNKVYDGNTDAAITVSGITGVVTPDVVTISGTGTFATSAIGNNITVSNVILTIGGAQAANYEITQPGDLTANITSGPTVLTAGDIAIIGYNTSGSPDNIAILVLKDLSAGTQFFVNDNELATAASTSFTDLAEAEASFTVKSGQTIPAGTVIVLPWGAAAVSTTTYDWSNTTGAGLGNNNEEIYIYTASSITATTPNAFIYFAKIGSSSSAVPNTLETSTTGSGTTAITPNGTALRYSTTGTVFNSCKQILLNEIGKTTANWNTTGASALAATDWSFTVLPTCPSPTIVTTGAVAALTAEYGSASANETFSVSGTFLTNTIGISAPAGFEISLNPTSGFAGTLTLTPTSGTVASTPVYVRLLATDLAGTYSGAISAATIGGTTVEVTIPSSTVTPKPLTISGIFINNKVENLGDFTATISGTPVLNGVLSIDNGNVTLDSTTATAVFTQDNAGTNIPVNVSGYAITGSAAANYSLTQPSGLTADITTVASPTITSALTFSSVYGTEITLPYQITADSDPSFPVTSYNATNLPAGLTFDSGTQTIIGAPTAAGNYNVTISATNAGGTTNAILVYTITKKEITVTATAVNKVYDADDTAAITVNSISGVFGSDDVTLTGGGSFDTKNVGTAKTVTANLVLSGSQSSNYSLTQPTDLSADITPFELTLTGAVAQNKVFDGTNTATIIATLVGIFAGDTVTFNGTGTFASATIGTGIAVTSTATLTGSDAGNYSFVQPTGLTANITDSVLYANALTGASACPTNGNIPTMAVNATGAPLTRTSVTCMSTGNVFNSTTLNTTATPSNTSYIEFSATATTGYQLNVRSLSFFRQASNSAPNQLEVRYSTDGFVSSSVTMTATPASPTSGTVLTWDFPDFNSTVAGTVTFRLYPYGTQRADGAGASSTTGTFRVDDVTIFGSVITPTIASLSLVGEDTVCNGSSSSVKVDVIGGASPYTVVYQNQTTAESFTVNNYVSGTSISVTPSTTGSNSYSLVSVTDANGLTSVVNGTANITVNTCSTESVLNLKLFIQGYYNGTGMVAARYDNLTASGLSAGNATDVDEVTVELHDGTTPSVVSYTVTGILQTDGSLAVTFPADAAGNSYYIVLKHRSSLQLWSANPVLISESTAYDFSTGLDQAYTDGSFEPMATLAPGVYGMYSGDLNQDDFIDPADFPSFELDQDNSAINGLYLLSGDMNGDTFVDPADYPVYDGNAYLGLFAQYPQQ
ncbi:MAG: YDG domain-containing protein [Flavobacterium sp. JAD_PAG50586_2]|nr:MAG: YDG domain-containing protein [Flavobacterium sp. JAD_PAG50586_2]